MIKQVIYSSWAIDEYNDSNLKTLLKIARQRNLEYNVTGLLLHGDNRFVQVIEGPSHNVEFIFDLILSDPRHHKIDLLHTSLVHKRCYESWSMADLPIWTQASSLDFAAFAQEIKEELGSESVTMNASHFIKRLSVSIIEKLNDELLSHLGGFDGSKPRH